MTPDTKSRVIRMIDQFYADRHGPTPNLARKAVILLYGFVNDCIITTQDTTGVIDSFGIAIQNFSTAPYHSDHHDEYLQYKKFMNSCFEEGKMEVALNYCRRVRESINRDKQKNKYANVKPLQLMKELATVNTYSPALFFFQLNMKPKLRSAVGLGPGLLPNRLLDDKDMEIYRKIVRTDVSIMHEDGYQKPGTAIPLFGIDPDEDYMTDIQDMQPTIVTGEVELTDLNEPLISENISENIGGSETKDN